MTTAPEKGQLKITRPLLVERDNVWPNLYYLKRGQKRYRKDLKYVIQCML